MRIGVGLVERKCGVAKSCLLEWLGTWWVMERSSASV